LPIFGVDIASGSPAGRQAPSYSLAVLEGDAVSTYHMISRHKLIRLIRQMQPEIVAMDNIHELASGRQELLWLLRKLPSTTQLVQVTGGEKAEALTRVARWHGISFDRLNPLEEALACARLASKGVGQAVSAFEDRTWIKVSRRRSPGRGGWSQNRYSRKIHGAVKALAREVEKQLREAGLEFTSRAVEGLGGYTRAEFEVEAARDKVHINPGYYSDAQLKVEGIARPQLQFRPLAQRRGYIIVGLDPGTTTGVAALNLQGELIDLISARAMSPADAIEWIASRGKPLLVATDVFPAPGAVERVKRSFNATLFSPGSDLSAEEKIALAKEFGYRNDHERDALAAANNAFKKYKNKFLLVEKKTPPQLDPDEVKALVVRGYSIENALEQLTPAPSAVERVQPQAAEPPVSAEEAAGRGQVQQLSEQVRNLKGYVEDLKLQLIEKEEETHRLSARLDRQRDKEAREIKRQAEIKIRDKEIERLRALLRSERKQMRHLLQDLSRRKKEERLTEQVEASGLRRLKILVAFSKEAVAQAAERGGIEKGDLILLQEPSGGGPNTVDLLAEKEVGAVIWEKGMPHALREYFFERGIPVFSSDELAVQRIGSQAFVRPEDLEAALARWREQQKLRQAERKAEWLEGMMQEYRVERRKEERRMKQG
jgi:predicted RNase H-like nuclease (RuvC/YqgF family)